MSCDWWRAAGQYCAVIGWCRLGEEAGDSLSFTLFAVFINEMEEAGWRKKFTKKVKIQTADDIIDCKLHYRCPFPTMK